MLATLFRFRFLLFFIKERANKNVVFFCLFCALWQFTLPPFLVDFLVFFAVLFFFLLVATATKLSNVCSHILCVPVHGF